MLGHKRHITKPYRFLQGARARHHGALPEEPHLTHRARSAPAQLEKLPGAPSAAIAAPLLCRQPVFPGQHSRSVSRQPVATVTVIVLHHCDCWRVT